MAQAKEESSLRSRTNSQHRRDSSEPERSLTTSLILIRSSLSSSCCERGTNSLGFAVNLHCLWPGPKGQKNRAQAVAWGWPAHPLIGVRFDPRLSPLTGAANRHGSKSRSLAYLGCSSPDCGRGPFKGSFSFFALFVVSPFLPPLAPRALPRFLATTEALSPSGHGSSGSVSSHHRRSFPAPDP